MKFKIVFLIVLLSMALGVSARTLVFKDVFDKSDPLQDAYYRSTNNSFSIGRNAWGWNFGDYQGVVETKYNNRLLCKKLDAFPCKQGHASRHIYFAPSHDFTINVDLSWDSIEFGSYEGDKSRMAGLLFGSKTNNGDSYYFGINAYGSYMLYSTKDAGGDSKQTYGYGTGDKQLTPLLQDSPSVSGLSEDKPWYKLRISRVKDKINFAIDNVVVHTIPAPLNMGSWVGLMLDGMQEAVFANFEVWQDDDFAPQIPQYEHSIEYSFKDSIPKGWKHLDSNQKTFSLNPDGMTVSTGSNSDDKSYSGSLTFPLKSLDEFMVELDTQCFSQAQQKDYTYGIQWGYSNLDMKNSFRIGPGGYYWINLASRLYIGPSSEINLSGANTLAIAKVGNKLYFLINGKIVADYPSASYHSLNVGIIQGENLQVNYESITIKHSSHTPDFAFNSETQKALKSGNEVFTIENPKKNKFSYTDKGLECNSLEVKKESYVMAPISSLVSVPEAFSCYVDITFDDVPQTGATGFFIGDPQKLVPFVGIDIDKSWHKRQLELGKNQRHGITGNFSSSNRYTHTLGLKVRGQAVRFYLNGTVIDSYPNYPSSSRIVIGILAEDKVKATYSNLKIFQSPRLSPPTLPLLFEEQFTSDDIYSNKEKLTTFNAHLNSGNMIIEKFSEDGGNAIFANTELDFYSDYVMEGVFKWTSGVDDSVYGMLLDFKDWSNFTSLGVSGNGGYRLYQTIDGVLYEVIPWNNDTLVNVKGTNKITLEKKDGAFFIYINDVLVDFCNCYNTDGSKFGYYVQGKQSFEVDWFKIYGTKK